MTDTGPADAFAGDIAPGGGPAGFLPDIVAARGSLTPDRIAYVFLDEHGAEWDRLDYATLHRRACGVAAELMRHCAPGARAVLAFPPGLDFIVAFVGCLYARVIAVPVPPPAPGQHAGHPAIGDCAPTVVLTERTLAGARGPFAAHVFPGPQICVDELDAGEIPAPATVDSGTLALLQYTSGSTSDPKGVMVTHGNLIANQRMIRWAFGHDEESVVVGWAPFYHDQGLIGNVLQPLYLGARAILMSPLTFIRRPLLWPATIARYGATTSGGPDFAYAACVTHARRSGVPDDLDLSTWRVAFNGAEPIRADTIRAFAATFSPYGFDESATYPCYGLAEATLLVTASRPRRGARVVRAAAEELRRGRFRPDPEGPALVGSGGPIPGSSVRIVSPEDGRVCAEGDVGEVWASGEHIAQGYWRNPEATEQVTGALDDEPGVRWLRTGDLGFVHDGEVYVVGRIKDLIIIRGRNIYPTDVENSVTAAHSALRPGGCAAFGFGGDPGGAEAQEIVVVAELRRAPGEDHDEIVADIRAAVAADIGVTIRRIRLIPAGGLPKTTSGKVRRAHTRSLFEQGRFETSERSV
ncbi:aminotransferase [Nocardia farcinica]|nr:aminotransferase [Nocardia farcinica]